MARTVGIGRQNFERRISSKCFCVGKTMFIKEWRDSKNALKCMKISLMVAAVIMAAGLSGCSAANFVSGNGQTDGNLSWEQEHYANEYHTEEYNTKKYNMEEDISEQVDISKQVDIGEQDALDTAQENNVENVLEDVWQESDKIAEIFAMPAGSIVDVSMLSADEIDKLFQASEISEEVFARIDGCSYQENDNISLEELSYIRVLHRGFDGETHIGELVVNRAVNEDIVDIMKGLYKADYPIERMVLVDEYGGDDNQSMAANNTSAFNYRTVSGTSKLSNHSYGLAIDINPLYNPYVRTASDGSMLCEPENGADYIDRSASFPYKIDYDDLCYQLFAAHGFTWGGDWRSVKDYQHFEKIM